MHVLAVARLPQTIQRPHTWLSQDGSCPRPELGFTSLCIIGANSIVDILAGVPYMCGNGRLNK